MKAKHFVQIGVIIAFVVTFLLISSSLLCFQCSADEIRMNLYYNESAESFDLLLYGPSSIRAGFIPTKAYEKYGITSYDYCVNSVPFPIIQYMIEESLQTQSPKMIVIDINSITYCNEDYTASNAVSFTENVKNKEIKDKINKNLLKKESKLEDNLSIYNYHSNWKNLYQCLDYKDFFDSYNNKSSFLKGYTTYNAGVYKFKEKDLVDCSTITQKVSFNEYETSAINSLLDYCDTLKDKIDIIFAKFPRLTLKNYNEWEIPYINALEEILTNKGYTFIDFATNLEEIGIKSEKHFADFTHLNHFGAEVFTEYLCKLLINEYSLTSSNTYSAEHWDLCVEVANEYYKDIEQGTKNNSKKEYSEFTLYMSSKDNKSNNDEQKEQSK